MFNSYLLMIPLQEVELLLQALQITPQSANDLVMVSLCPPQRLTVPLYRLAQGGLSLPSAKELLATSDSHGNDDNSKGCNMIYLNKYT